MRRSPAFVPTSTAASRSLAVFASSLICAVAASAAADPAPAAAPSVGDATLTRVGGELLLGTEGLEIGATAELALPASPWRLRGEVLLTDGPGLGLGIAGLYPIPLSTAAGPDALDLGPRAVLRLNDDSSLELGGIIQYHLKVSADGRHQIPLIGALGMLFGKDDLEFAATIGAGYSYRF